MTGTFIGFESRAHHIRNFELSIIPGLLQTAEYTAAVIGGLNPGMAPQQLNNLVATRMARQSILRHTDLQYEAIIDEGVLKRPIGGSDVLRMQLRQLRVAVERSNVSLRVLPTAAGVSAGIRGASCSWISLDLAARSKAGGSATARIARRASLRPGGLAG